MASAPPESKWHEVPLKAIPSKERDELREITWSPGLKHLEIDYARARNYGLNHSQAMAIVLARDERLSNEEIAEYLNDKEHVSSEKSSVDSMWTRGKNYSAPTILYVDKDGRWVTIGAQEVEVNGKKRKEGGTPVFISSSGEILKGPSRS